MRRPSRWLTAAAVMTLATRALNLIPAVRQRRSPTRRALRFAQAAGQNIWVQAALAVAVTYLARRSSSAA